MNKRKTPMTISISKYGVGLFYKCYHMPDNGKKCDDRDDGTYCMRCKYCKAELSAQDATRLLNSFGSHMEGRE